jgi:hypothetical protein
MGMGGLRFGWRNLVAWDDVRLIAWIDLGTLPYHRLVVVCFQVDHPYEALANPSKRYCRLDLVWKPAAQGVMAPGFYVGQSGP